jgi:hypothetical protein
VETAKIEFATSRRSPGLDAKRALYQLSYVPDEGGAGGTKTNMVHGGQTRIQMSYNGVV